MTVATKFVVTAVTTKLVVTAVITKLVRTAVMTKLVVTAIGYYDEAGRIGILLRILGWGGGGCCGQVGSHTNYKTNLWSQLDLH